MMTTPPFSGVLFGAAYYAEYQPGGSLDRDLDLMVEAGFSVIRVGESVWSTWEPREGEFHLDWLEPVLDGAFARRINVILGTPTYAIPMWLARRHPEIAAVRADGHPIGWGARQEADQSHPAFRFYAERIVRKVVGRYAEHPAVIGFQVDNEPGLELPHNEHTFQAFVDWLRQRYGSVEQLNREWGLVYWSHLLSDWADLWRPEGNKQPQYQLEWRRFQSSLAAELIGWQADLVRDYKQPGQFITTCISYSRPQVADDKLVEALDITAGNPYYLMQRGLDAGRDEPRRELWQHESVWGLLQWADRAWSSKQAPFLVTETNAQSTGQSQAEKFPPFSGQIKQAALALLSRGCRMIEYWHWHTLHFGVETYWGGVLPHSQRPGRIYREVADLGATIRAIGAALDEYEPDADVLMLWSTDTKWSFEFYGPLSDEDGSPDPHSYWRIFDAHYRGFAEAGAQVRIAHPRQVMDLDPGELASRFPVLVAAGLYVADNDLLEHLRAYALAGGHLVLGVRTGYGDELARARRDIAPAIIGPAVGVWYDEFSTLRQPLVVENSAELDVEAGSAGTAWVELLELDGAEQILGFTESELQASVALASREVGLGRISTVACVPNAALSRSIARWLVPDREKDRWSASGAVTISSGHTPTARIAFAFNWSATPTQLIAPAAVTDLVSGQIYPVGAHIPLDRRAALVFEVTDGSIEQPDSPFNEERTA